MKMRSEKRSNGRGAVGIILQERRIGNQSGVGQRPPGLEADERPLMRRGEQVPRRLKASLAVEHHDNDEELEHRERAGPGRTNREVDPNPIGRGIVRVGS